MALAAKHRLPAFDGLRELVDAGGLMSDGESMAESYRSLADCLAKIAAGAKPGDLPVAQLTQFEPVNNMNTAKALGTAIPSRSGRVRTNWSSSASRPIGADLAPDDVTPRLRGVRSRG